MGREQGLWEHIVASELGSLTWETVRKGWAHVFSKYSLGAWYRVIEVLQYNGPPLHMVNVFQDPGTTDRTGA